MQLLMNVVGICEFLSWVSPSSAFAASLDGALSPMVGPGYVLLAKQFNVSVDNVTSSFGFILLGLGIFMYAIHRLRHVQPKLPPLTL